MRKTTVSGDIIANNPPPPWFLKIFETFFFSISYWIFQHILKMKQIGYTEFYALHLAQESIDDTSVIKVLFYAQLYSSLIPNPGFICRKSRSISKIYTKKMIIIIFSRFEVFFSSKKVKTFFFFFFWFSDFHQTNFENFRTPSPITPPPFLFGKKFGRGGLLAMISPDNELDDLCRLVCSIWESDKELGNSYS